jgi:hypothetical protein
MRPDARHDVFLRILSSSVLVHALPENARTPKASEDHPNTPIVTKLLPSLCESVENM